MRLFIGLAWVFSLLGGCKQLQPLQQTIIQHDSTIIHDRLVPIHVEGSSITRSLSRAQYDSLVLALRVMPTKNKTIYITDPKSQTRLSVFLDSIGRLRFTCETLSKEYQARLQEKDRTISFYEKTVLKQHETFWHQLKRYAFIGLAVIAIIAVLVIFAFIKGILK